MAAKAEQTTPKLKYNVRNWREYNQSLKLRGSLTFWIDDKAISQWWAQEENGQRGRDNTYSDVAIQTFLMMQAVYGLSLRSTQGLIDSVFQLMKVALVSPDYSCVSKRAKRVPIDIHKPKGAVSHLVLDSTGLKVFGEGEWKTRKHGKEKRRTWRKLHLGVDAGSQHIICSELSLESVHDGEVLPVMLNKLRRQIGKVSGDGAYDTKRCYQVTMNKGAEPNFPPRKNAGNWHAGHPRNKAVEALKEGRLAQWKAETDYHQRSLSETAMWRYKQLTGEKLRLRDYNAQVGEAQARVAVLNKITGLGMPDGQMIR